MSIRNLEKVIADLRAVHTDSNILKFENSILKTKNQQLISKTHQWKKVYNKLQKKFEEAKKQNEELKTEKDELESDFEELQEEHALLVDYVDGLEKKNKDLEDKLVKLTNDPNAQSIKNEPNIIVKQENLESPATNTAEKASPIEIQRPKVRVINFHHWIS